MADLVEPHRIFITLKKCLDLTPKKNDPRKSLDLHQLNASQQWVDKRGRLICGIARGLRFIDFVDQDDDSRKIEDVDEIDEAVK